MSEILNRFCAFIGGPYVSLTGDNSCAGIIDVFPCNRHPTAEDDKSAHLMVLEHLQVHSFFCCTIHL